jgi:gamma-glutamyltranspeptidase/glutathione hydrolase
VAVVLWFSERTNGETGALDYREAPLAATKNMYLDTEGNVIEGKVPPHQ